MKKFVKISDDYIIIPDNVIGVYINKITDYRLKFFREVEVIHYSIVIHMTNDITAKISDPDWNKDYEKTKQIRDEFVSVLGIKIGEKI